jgi:hypothetical protein
MHPPRMAYTNVCSLSTTTPTTCGCGLRSRKMTRARNSSPFCWTSATCTRGTTLHPAISHVLKFDSDSVSKPAVTCQMCDRLDFGVHYSAPYAHHMIGKAKRPLCTLCGNVVAMLHILSVPNSMWSCAVNTVVYLRNCSFSHALGLSGGFPITLYVQIVRRVQVSYLRVHRVRQSA